jgi:beta-lactam-binding protein with PASTA domain
MSQSKAETTLKAAGLNVKVIKSSGRLLNLVKNQSPGVGTMVPRGTLVTITIV